MKKLLILNETIVTKRAEIKEAKNVISLSLKEVLNIVLADVKKLKSKNDKLSKKEALKELRATYSTDNNLDGKVKSIFTAVADYMLYNLSIKFNEVTAEQFLSLISYFRKSILTADKKHYVKGFNKVFNADLLNNCLGSECYSELLKEAKNYILEQKEA